MVVVDSVDNNKREEGTRPVRRSLSAQRVV